MVLRFRQPPTNGRIFAAGLVFVALLLAASLVPIGMTFGSASENLGLGIAVTLTLLVAGAATATFYRMMTPMRVEAGGAGLTLIDERTSAGRTLGWGDFTYTLVEGTGEWVLMIHDDRRTFVIKQHPVYAKSPPAFGELCDAVVKNGKPAD